MLYNMLIKKYEYQNMLHAYDNNEISNIAPIAHTRITAHIGIMLDIQGHALAVAKIHQSVLAPCTAKSESRTAQICPHLIDDKIAYVADINTKKHSAYLNQLKDYVTNSGNIRANAVYKYMVKNTINVDLGHLIDIKNPKNDYMVVTFGVIGAENTIDDNWTQYHLSKLPKNGICAITGLPDYMPDSYPAGIRYPGDMARLFVAKSNIELDSMPVLRPGYIASQKILHTLQALCGGWVEQGDIPAKDICILQN